jgi:hypothetical protein
MKTELFNIIQMIFILTFFIGIVACTIASFKNTFKKAGYKLVSRIYILCLDYWRHMTVNDYISYEKYNIWRYCVHF